MFGTLDHHAKIDPRTHPALLRWRLRTVVGRLEEVEAELKREGDDTNRGRELLVEKQTLAGMRHELEVLRLPPPPKVKPVRDEERERQRRRLQNQIADETRAIHWQSKKWDDESDHHHARIHRLQLPMVAELVIREIHLDPALLDEIEPKARVKLRR